MTLPYRYGLLVRVTVEGDGMHADGDGAMATYRRLAVRLEGDPRVVDVAPLPADVHYLGKTSEDAPEPPNALRWESADHEEEPRDQNADTTVASHGYWSLGPILDFNGDEVWSVELVVQNEQLDVVEERSLGAFQTEESAKAAAQAYEDKQQKPPSERVLSLMFHNDWSRERAEAHVAKYPEGQRHDN